MKRPSFRTVLTLLVVSLCLLLSSGSTVPTERYLSPSYAMPQYHAGQLNDLLAPLVEANPGKSGMSLIPEPDNALFVRLAMIQAAEHTLDLQYYIWKGDQSGLLLLEQLLEAAERGVRVRLLLDDHTIFGQNKPLEKLSTLPNFEIKLYNPYGNRRSSSFARTLAFLGEFNRLNHRMHNKVLVADNQLAIVGGRNIGDEYFGASRERNFHDLDLFVAGPVVNEVSHSFDSYWNSDWAISPKSLSFTEVKTATFAEAKATLQSARAILPPLPYSVEDESQALLDSFQTLPERLYWGDARVTVDPPRKDLKDELPPQAVSAVKLQLIRDTQDEILVATPYFVPSRPGIQGLSVLRERGVRLKVLTNSLEATDVAVAHYGHMLRRRQTLETGTQVYEYRPDGATALDLMPESQRHVPVGLHAKVAVYDRKVVYIGSANLDPRSALLNTEIGLVINSPDLAEQVIHLLDADVAPDSSYWVELVDQETCWHWQQELSKQAQCQEPGLRWRDRIGVGMLGILPVEKQL